jgi:hypothetical protein
VEQSDHAAAADGAGRRVFLSHASENADRAGEVCAHLERVGLRCWIAPRDIRPGRDWSREIIAGIDGSRAMVVLVSAEANASRQVAREVERADDRGIPLFPVRLADVEPGAGLEYFLGGSQWIDAFRPPFSVRMDHLVGAITADEPAEQAAEHAAAVPAREPVPDIPPDDWDRRKGSGLFRRLLDDR